MSSHPALLDVDDATRGLPAVPSQSPRRMVDCNDVASRDQLLIFFRTLRWKGFKVDRHKANKIKPGTLVINAAGELSWSPSVFTHRQLLKNIRKSYLNEQSNCFVLEFDDQQVYLSLLEGGQPISPLLVSGGESELADSSSPALGSPARYSRGAYTNASLAYFFNQVAASLQSHPGYVDELLAAVSKLMPNVDGDDEFVERLDALNTNPDAFTGSFSPLSTGRASRDSTSPRPTMSTVGKLIRRGSDPIRNRFLGSDRDIKAAQSP